MKQATVSLFYDQRKGVNTVKLLVGFGRQQRQYTTGHKVDAKTFERLKTNSFKHSPDGKIKDQDFLNLWKNLFSRDELKPGYAVFAQSVAEELGPNFTFDRFKKQLGKYGKEPEDAPVDTTDLLSALSRKETSMIAEDRIGNGVNYGLAGKSLRRFIESLTDGERIEFGLSLIPKRTKRLDPAAVTTLHYQNLTPSLLRLYEEWMTTDQGLTLTTVGIYCRHVRAVYNDAINDGIVSRDNYPFGKNRYVIPAGKNLKKALSKVDVKKIIEYQPEEGMEQRAKDFWLLSYLCNGMNFSDILSLRWKDIDRQASKLSFLRQKTVRSTKGKQVRVRVEVVPESWDIIERWANSDKSPMAYVFPFLSDDMDARRKKTVTSQVIKITNKYIRIIAEKLGIEDNVTTYAARHSFATILLRSEVPLAFISQSLGHTNISTTEAYLGSFDDEQTKKYMQSLT